MGCPFERSSIAESMAEEALCQRARVHPVASRHSIPLGGFDQPDSSVGRDSCAPEGGHAARCPSNTANPPRWPPDRLCPGLDRGPEHRSAGRRATRRLLQAIRPGETPVVVRLDRLARSVSHLLAVIEQLEGQGDG